MKHENLFFTIEGPDGSGKSTQTRLTREYIEAKGFAVLQTREPGGTPIGEKIRALLLDNNNQEMQEITETLLYAAARAQLTAEVIRPALEAGKVVLCDRFLDSSIAYQGYGRKLGSCVEEINEIAVAGCMPRLTFLLTLDPAIGKARITGHDRMEMEKLDYHNRVYEGYIRLAEKYPDRIKKIDATGPQEMVQLRIREYIDKILIVKATISMALTDPI